MSLTRVLLEATLVWVSAAAGILLWGQAIPRGWVEVLTALEQAIAPSICFVVSFYYNDLYDLRIVHSFRQFALRLPQAFGVGFILLAAAYTILPDDVRVSNGAFAVSVMAVPAVLLAVRALSYGLMRHRQFLERVLILGRGPLAEKIMREVAVRPHLGYEIVGVADDATATGHSLRGYPLLGPLEHLGKIVEEIKPNRIIVALAERRARLPVRQLLEARLNGSVVEDGVDAYERVTGKIAIEALTPSNLIFSRDFKKSRLDLAMGRVASLVVAVLGLTVFSPLLVLIAIAIKLDSQGSLFFIQDRIGMNAKRFRLVKFRTMHAVDGHTSEWEADNSDRITRVGRILRKFRLDELPQFVNVIRGDMNLVGPRPHPLSNLERFVEGIPYYSLRAVVRPGITGWAQVRLGYANNLEEETEKMRYDLYYIKRLSFWLDLRILFDTVKIVFFGRGSQSADAYRPQATVEMTGR
jgi:exopolysaccharide biosynthesis polyprenyl glycosylphosphotransferase